jgi:hypothetical protein
MPFSPFLLSLSFRFSLSSIFHCHYIIFISFTLSPFHAFATYYAADTLSLRHFITLFTPLLLLPFHYAIGIDYWPLLPFSYATADAITLAFAIILVSFRFRALIRHYAFDTLIFSLSIY